MGTFIYWPPLKKTSGGMRVLGQLANQLAKAGEHVSLAISSNIAPAIPLDEKVALAAFQAIQLSPQDKWIIPEGWPNALAPGLKAGSQCGVFAQNWLPFHETLPKGVYWKNLPVAMLAVSHPVMNFIQQTTGLAARILPPALDHEAFYPNPGGKPALPRDTIRIAYMPRKNRAMITQIRGIVEARLNLAQKAWQLQWVEIHNQPYEKVGDLLRSAHIFLSAGFPEGFGLPPLEAMACGCVVAGFTGFGGWEYMRQSNPGGAAPPFPLQPVEWKANGYFAYDGDVWGGALALEQAIKTVMENGVALKDLQTNGQKAASWFSRENQAKAIAGIWADEAFWTNPAKRRNA